MGNPIKVDEGHSIPYSTDGTSGFKQNKTTLHQAKNLDDVKDRSKIYGKIFKTAEKGFNFKCLPGQKYNKPEKRKNYTLSCSDSRPISYIFL